MTPYDSIIITGSNGMLAHAVIRNLAARGRKPAAAVDVADCDITSPEQVLQTFCGS